MMNFAAILAICEFDNYVGQWYLNLLTPHDAMMEIEVTGIEVQCKTDGVTYPAIWQM